ncbi:MAG: tetratricopeptide repeat protein [Anaerolineales bacterium]|nr:tetratricopeptide repeat protein [Anaerolineales bacterium]
MRDLKLTFMGTMEVAAGDETALHFRTDKIRGLLVYLALESDRPHQRRSLAALFWPDMPEETALKNLRQSLYRLQQTLETAVPTLGSTVFTINRQAVQCHAAALTADVLTFQRLLAESAAHAHRHLHLCLPCLERLAAAADLYQGELLAGFSLPDAVPFEEWLLFWREKLQQQMMATLASLADAYEQRGAYEAAHGYAARQIWLDPFREAAHRQVMRLLANQGRHSEALLQYETCRRVLAAELGVAPAAETTALYRQVQLAQQGQPAGQIQPPIAMHHFPLQFTPFIGREAELQQIQEQFLDPDCRLLTLVGPGGMGKTRLSIRAAELLANGRSRSQFADGIYFFSLASVRSTGLLLTNLLTGLGVSAVETGDPQATLHACLRDRHCLLVLDNFEQLIESAPLLAEIVAAAPGVRLLVSSHLPLQLRAERRLTVRGLAYPGDEAQAADRQAADDLPAYDAVRLFVESARHVAPAFQLTPQNAASVLTICRLVAGMPLALEIAAAWVRLMDCAAIVAELHRSLDILSLAPQDMPDRHSGITAVFRYSWNLLAPAEQTMLSQLSVFRGPFSLEAAMHVTGLTPLIVARLLDSSLLERSQDGRYYLHELLRQFAARQAADRDAAARRHSDYYLGLVAAQERALYGPQPRQAAAALQPDLANVRQAWQWAAAHGHWTAIEHSLEGLGRFYHVTALVREGEAAFAQAAHAANSAGNSGAGPATKAGLCVWQAYFQYRLGRRSDAISLAEQALAETGADDATRAEVHSLLGELLPAEARFQEAVAYLEQAVAYYRATADLMRLARTLQRLTLAYWRSGSYEETLRTAQQALPVFQALAHKRGLAQLYNLLAGVCYERGELTQTLVYIQQSQALYEAIDDKLDAAVVAANLAGVYRRLGRYDEALASNQRAIEIGQELGDRPGLARDLSNRGLILATIGEFERGLDYYYRALEIEQALGNPLRMAYFQTGIAAVYDLKGDETTALTYYDLALPVLLAQATPFHLVEALLGKAALLIRRGEWAEGRALNARALQLATETGLAEFVHQSRLLAAKLAFGEGDAAQACRQLTEMLAETADEAEQAELHYELWLMTNEAVHAETAVGLYEQLYRQNPSFVNRQRLHALRAVDESGLGSS